MVYINEDLKNKFEAKGPNLKNSKIERIVTRGFRNASKPKKINYKMRRWGLFFIIILLLFLFIAWPTISDYWVVYTADQAMIDLADRANMSFKGKATFLRMDPEVVPDQVMIEACGFDNSEGAESFVEQGCYLPNSNDSGSGKIYIREMPTELDDMEVVTAAHELLHPIYFRLSDTDDSSKLDAIIEENFTLNNNDDLTSQVADYAISEPGYRAAELFSILGTEYSNISVELMSYYSLYFNDDLDTVVAANNHVYAVFDSMKIELDSIALEIENYSDLADSELESANYAYYCSTTWAEAGNTYENTRNYNIYLQMYEIYEGYIAKQNVKVDEYNNLLDKYNVLITELSGEQPLENI